MQVLPRRGTLWYSPLHPQHLEANRSVEWRCPTTVDTQIKETIVPYDSTLKQVNVDGHTLKDTEMKLNGKHLRLQTLHKELYFQTCIYKILMLYTQSTKKMVSCMYLVARAAVTEYHRLRRVNHRNLFLHGSRKVQDEVVSRVSFFLGLLPCLLDCLLLPVSSHGHPSVHFCILISSSNKNTRHIGLGSSLMFSF